MGSNLPYLPSPPTTCPAIPNLLHLAQAWPTVPPCLPRLPHLPLLPCQGKHACCHYLSRTHLDISCQGIGQWIDL